ncbi:MAG: class I tRNA ligase family protein, partial [Pseudomonadota bacterium]
GNVIDPFELVELYGLDKVRYFFMREVPFGNDGSYSHEAIITRTNADLANGLGNLAQRSLSMIAKNLDGVLPEPGQLQSEDQALINACLPALETARTAMSKQQIHKALEAIFDVVSAGDRYVDTMAPWALRKSDPDRMNSVLYTVAETVRRIAIMCLPFMPESSGKLLDLVAVPEDKRNFANIDDALAGGTVLPKPEGVFPRFVEKAG